jgi:hypothetical protein
MGEMRNSCMILVGKSERKVLDGRGRLIWEDNIKIESGLDSSGSVAGSQEHGNTSSSFIKGREFLDRLSYSQLLKKDSAP